MYHPFAEVRGEEEDGEITRIPCAPGTPFGWRVMLGFEDCKQDQERLAEAIPGITAPWGATLIPNHRSMMLTHAVFALAERSLDTLCTLWTTTFIDFIRLIDEEWEMLVGAIGDGHLPQLPEMDDVYSSISPTFSANPDRAKELRNLGPPSQTAEGWATKAWPRFELLIAITTGTFGRVLPKARAFIPFISRAQCLKHQKPSQVRAYIGPDVPVRNVVYASAEGGIGIVYNDRLPNVVQVVTDDYIEFLEITPADEDGELKRMWEVDVGKIYEPVITMRNGLWRYRMADAVQVVGFSPIDGVPLIEYKERRHQLLRVGEVLVSQADILAFVDGVEGINESEFVTWCDDRGPSPTLGFFLEKAPERLSLALETRETILSNIHKQNENLPTASQQCIWERPTIRLLAPGTFREFRQWKGKLSGMGSAQIKVPTILADPKGREFFCPG
ncbi:hypothetical protein CONPUDRAFT_165674 [Coniophora puteana RWD-64-598 SS2]|uniref:GH3 middle domain-containing protein n=1 Tax=Coniophora puteana (strain RWD-64-598) TaxID=741705 RepID=A0A5M3MR68_CONPW|nr:uncharacterized protein CONPUDRAFT_165674 [Coniophora puteana RWD-64-598 SS2]EIW81566.1 hypothetical protein CONPUDRAFT_165674 [Coniophora puteana RWD-64-598 SS2]